MDWYHKIRKIIVMLVSIMFIGTFGYMAVEGWSLLDAFYMTVLTISTVGYAEVHPLTNAGKLFSSIFIIVGVGGFFYIISIIAEFIISGHIAGALGRRRMKKHITAYKDHFIICGFGRVGEQVAVELAGEGVDFVVIDNSAESLKKCARKQIAYVEGNASDDEILKEAGIDRAKGLVTATDSDAENVYVTLSAKSLRGDLLVVARATSESAQHKILKAGADRVISPYTIGGKRLARLLLRPAVVEFLDVVMAAENEELLMEDVRVRDKSIFIGASIAQAREKCIAGANILAIKKKGEKRMHAHPSSGIIIELGDHLVAMGTRDQLKELEKLS